MESFLLLFIAKENSFPFPSHFLDHAHEQLPVWHLGIHFLLYSGCPGGRLVNGTTCSGRVEIRHGDTWGRLCSSHWNLQAASVLCYQLNCGYAKSIQTGDSFVDGNGPVWRDAFHCKGTESCLWDCAQVTLGNPTCSAKEVATVVCSGKSGMGFYTFWNFTPKQSWWSHFAKSSAYI